MLNWAKQFSILLLLDSNNYKDKYSRYSCLLAVGAKHVIDSPADALDELKEYQKKNKCWLFGHINYDYKNTLEPCLSSTDKDSIGFPVISFFHPEAVCYVNVEQTTLTIEAVDADSIYNSILKSTTEGGATMPDVEFKHKVGKEQYLNTVDVLRAHIKEGDCYEINYCTEGYAENVLVEPLHVYKQLNKLSSAPFAAYYRNEDMYMMCASPERYIQKQGDKVIAQPIKGTIRRSSDLEEDAVLKEELRNSVKDKAENVMITDLLRNDLARSCKIGSINVEELYGIYSFPQVHQMISTVTGEVRDDISFVDVLRHSFPMGSMTGAPKVKVMELIEKYEQSARGLFSGTVGYISPSADFDFNVIIRSLFYNANTQKLSYQTGGAITYDSRAEAEWDEMRLKAWALERVFSNG